VSEPVYTYFVHSPGLNAVKIGKSARPLKRLCAIQGGIPDVLQILGILDGDREFEFHNRFDEYRKTGEWFSLGPKLADFLKAKFKFGLQPHPTAADLTGLIMAADIAAQLRIKESMVPRLGITSVLAGSVGFYRQADVEAYIESHTEYILRDGSRRGG
jgi:hypothetical protein